MTPLSTALLELDVSAMSLAQICGESERGKAIRERVSAVRRAAAEARIADLAAHPEQVPPKQAVQAVIEQALRAGVEFPEIVGWVNGVREDNPGAAR
jgi:hypothetical protein